MPKTSRGDHLIEVLRVAIMTSGVRMGTLERALGMSKGYLSQVLLGRIELKVAHLEVILDRIGFEPQEFFRLVYPPPGEETGVMQGLTAYAGRRPLRLHAADLRGLRAAVEAVVREVLAAGERS